ncbi:hypothetical protein [Paenibacillus sp. FSL R10-2736]|uniref:hypothetical protein n=1 Tax=Paenibacillus sp. FSL R10-2736 TaxID=2954692 RepID=UPI0030FC2F87
MNNYDDIKGFLLKPYAERQLIVVLSDEQIKKKEKEQKRRNTPINSILKFGLSTFTVSVGVPYVELVEALYKSIKELREKGVNTVPVSQTLSNNLKFPIGHPRFKVLYVAHPAKSDVYYPFAQFHRFTFEHKFSEAITLLMSLGASYIEVEHVTGWSKEFSTRLGISIPAAMTNLESEVSSNTKKDSQLLFTANLDPKLEAALPENLVWYHHEPTWQQIADGRLKYGLKDFSLSVRYEDDLGVNTSLKQAATNAGLDISGRFEDHESTVWRIAGRFE